MQLRDSTQRSASALYALIVFSSTDSEHCALFAIDEADYTTVGMHFEGTHWASTTLALLDTWCGSTCHSVLRYLLRSLLVLALAGTILATVMRSVDSKCRSELERKVGLDRSNMLLKKSELGSDAGMFDGGGVGAKPGRSGRVRSGGPDVKDSCVIM